MHDNIFFSTTRPGGLSLTQKILAQISINGKKVLDIGCGRGATVHWLRAQGIEAYGVDCSIESEKYFLYQADAKELPFKDHSIDLVLMECSLSVIDQPQKSLYECLRVLRPSGYLIMSDIFSRGEPMLCSGNLKEIRQWATILSMMQEAGFCLDMFWEEQSALHSCFAQLLFESTENIFEVLGTTEELLKRADISYFAAIFRV